MIGQRIPNPWQDENAMQVIWHHGEGIDGQVKMLSQTVPQSTYTLAIQVKLDFSLNNFTKSTGVGIGAQGHEIGAGLSVAETLQADGMSLVIG